MTYRVELSFADLKPAFRYMNELVNLTCFSDLLAAKVFPNAKELTESAAAYNAVRKHLRGLFDLNDPTVSLFAVGDGCTPRTAAMFAFRSAWQCYSIDPRLKEKEYNIQRLTLVPLRVEDARYVHQKGWFPKVVLVAVHSHAPLPKAVASIPSDTRAVVAIPCCVKQELHRPPDIEYVDKGIWSPENKVKIWRNV